MMRGRSPRPPSGLLARLDAKLDKTAGPDACWPFIGAASRSGRRNVSYPHLREGGRGSRHWRVCRLVLLLADLPEEAFLSEEALSLWLKLANLSRREVEAAHYRCDNARCGNASHLRWEPHGQNVGDQAARRRAMQQEAQA